MHINGVHQIAIRNVADVINQAMKRFDKRFLDTQPHGDNGRDNQRQNDNQDPDGL
ncbi:hypothetical protein D3C75_618040 [compost metagenome]